MKYTFLGHQSWLFSEGDTKILMDPLLEDTFGSNSQYGIEVVPPRIIKPEIYNNIDAILLSHEHTDHFHLRSLNKINRSAVVYVGILTLQPVVEAIKALGFSVKRVHSKETVKVDNISITFFQAHPKTVIWESRVYQFLITSKICDYSIFVAVDALISRDFEEEVTSEKIKKPDTIMISNNSQIPPKGVQGSLDNAALPEHENRKRTGPIGLRLVKGIIIDYSDLVHDLEHIILCGGGFMKSGDTFGEFMMSHQGKVAALARPIFPDKKIFGALPGMVFENNLSSHTLSSAIAANKVRENELKEKFKLFQKNPNWKIKSLSPSIKADFKPNCKHIVDSFKSRHRQIMCSQFGRILVSRGDPHNSFELMLKDDQHSQQIRFNFNWLTNDWNEIGIKDPTRPFGIMAMAADFSEIVKGNLQIWDIAGLSISSWYDPKLGNSLNYSPMGLLYAVYGEHFNVDQFAKYCRKKLLKLNADAGEPC